MDRLLVLTVARKVLYPWHPWYGLTVQVHQAFDKETGYFRCRNAIAAVSPFRTSDFCLLLTTRPKVDKEMTPERGAAEVTWLDAGGLGSVASSSSI